MIGTAYMKGENDPDYDHILPFIGFQSSHDATNYYDDDDLVFYDNYEDTAFTRSFSAMYGTRSEAASGAHAYYIPTNDDYGCAVTGIVDPHHETAPIQLSVDRWDEPERRCRRKARHHARNVDHQVSAAGKNLQPVEI